MSGYEDLRSIGVTFRPFDGTPPPAAERPSPFEASWSDTVALLARELRHLGARNVVVELAVTERDLRVDGLPRANARLSHDGVRVSFDSKWGPLRYETGEFAGSTWRGAIGWQSNLRAVALAMEALRKVDRYGVSKRGEQYRGWRQIEAGGVPADNVVTPEQARETLLRATGLGHVPSDATMNWREIGRAAVRRTHPDAGGDRDDFERVQKAREILGVS